jgi:hypothetical protein
VPLINKNVKKKHKKNKDLESDEQKGETMTLR